MCTGFRGDCRGKVQRESAAGKQARLEPRGNVHSLDPEKMRAYAIPIKRARTLRYRRMPIELESPEAVGCGNIRCNCDIEGWWQDLGAFLRRTVQEVKVKRQAGLRRTRALFTIKWGVCREVLTAQAERTCCN